jgi:hypothetical protein
MPTQRDATDRSGTQRDKARRSCKQQVPGSSPGASSRTRSSEPYGACLTCPGSHSAAIPAVSGLASFARSTIDPPPRLRWARATHPWCPAVLERFRVERRSSQRHQRLPEPRMGDPELAEHLAGDRRLLAERQQQMLTTEPVVTQLPSLLARPPAYPPHARPSLAAAAVTRSCARPPDLRSRQQLP